MFWKKNSEFQTMNELRRNVLHFHYKHQGITHTKTLSNLSGMSQRAVQKNIKKFDEGKGLERKITYGRSKLNANDKR